MNDGHSRADPPIWDHQHHVLRGLRQAIDRSLPKLSLPAGGQVVDLGCGSRPYEAMFIERHCVYIACDLDGPCDVRLVPGQPVPLPSNEADTVVSFQVLEHVWDVKGYLAEARRLLKPGGTLLLSTHGTWLHHPHPTDFHRWTREGLIREIEEAAFDVASVESVVGPLAWTTQFRLLGLRHAVVKLPVVGAPIAAAVSIAMNVRMKLEDAITPESMTRDNAAVYVVVATPRST